MSTEPDVQELRADVEQIKNAMGIADRYDDTGTAWLGYAVLVVIAAALSQFVVLERLDPLYHTPIWLVIIGGGTALLGRYLDGDAEWSAAGKPRVVVVFAVLFGLTLPIQLVVGPFVSDPGYLGGTAMVLGLILVLLGAAYLLLGNLLRSYRIRLADRAALYVGGGLLIALGVTIPNVTALHTWGYTAFGVGYAVYALAAYAVLGR